MLALHRAPAVTTETRNIQKMVTRTEDRWGKLQGALHEVAPLVVGKASEAAWKKWLQLPLELACRAGQLSVVEKLLAAGAEPASAGYDGEDWSLIHSAVLGNSLEVFAALLKAGCQDDLDARASAAWMHRTPLHMAVWRRKTAMAHGLLAAGADAAAADAKGLTPLHLASIRADVPMMRRLLASDGVDLEARTTAGLTPLYIGLCNRQVESVTFLLGVGAAMVSPPYQHPPFLVPEGRSCLFAAVERGYNEMIGILIEAGADVHERINGWSVMCAAARTGNAFAVHALNDAGAPVVETDGDAPIFYAAREGQVESTKALLARGTPVDVRARASGKTPLHVAAEEGSAHVVRVLLDHDADAVASVDDEGKTPACPIRRAYFRDDDPDSRDTGPFRAFEYGGGEWEGEEDHAHCINLMIKNARQDKKDELWAPRRNSMMLVARHRKGAATAPAAPPLEHGGGKRLACGGGDGGAPAALPVGGGASEAGLDDEGTTTAEDAAVLGGEDALRSMVALLASLGEEHLLRRIVRLL